MKIINDILEYLDELYPDARCELLYDNDWQLLLAIVLSAQATDKGVNKVTRKLFSKYKSLYELSMANVSDIEDIIHEIGTFHKKSIYIHEIAKILVNDGFNIIPNDREYLESLPGVGHKTANVFLGIIYNEPTIAVDTHVSRVSKRLGLVNNDDNVLDIEKKLIKKIPKEKWNMVHHQLVLFGRYKCKSINPECINCKLKNMCKKKVTK